MEQSKTSGYRYSFPIATFLSEVLFSKSERERNIAKRLAVRNREKALQTNQEMVAIYEKKVSLPNISLF